MIRGQDDILDDLDTGVDIGLPAAAVVLSNGCIAIFIIIGVIVLALGLMIGAGGWL